MVKREIMLIVLCALFVAYMPFTSYHIKTSSQSDMSFFILKSAYGQTPDLGSPDQSQGDNSTNISNATDNSSGPSNPSDITGQNDTSSNPDESSNTSVGGEGEFNLDNTTASAGVQGENNQNNNNTSVGSEGEIENENNNEKATHEENQQDANNMENAVENKTVAAEVNIGTGNEETTSIDSNINVHTNSTSDAVSVTVDSKTESGPKVIVFNLNSTTIDVSNVKYLHVTYDGHPIAPATDVNAVLHPKSTDEPSYAILITQNGAQIIVSIPHFSSHTITLSNISKVIPPVPEFPIPALALIVALISIVIFSKVSTRGKN